MKKLLLICSLLVLPIVAMEAESSGSGSGNEADDETSLDREHSDTWEEPSWRQRLAAAKRATLTNSGNAFRLRRRRSAQMKEQQQSSGRCWFSCFRRKK